MDTHTVRSGRKSRTREPERILGCRAESAGGQRLHFRRSPAASQGGSPGHNRVTGWDAPLVPWTMTVGDHSPRMSLAWPAWFWDT